jgi:hypothetical protein
MRPKRSDIPTSVVLRSIEEQVPWEPGGLFAFDVLAGQFPRKVVLAAFRRDTDAGLLEYGTAEEHPWLTPEGKDRLRIDEHVADLRERGYVDIEEFEGLRAGVRVRHRGEQYRAAYRDGTGNVLHVLQRDPSSWARSWGRPDVEIVVVRDDVERGAMLVADYHVVIVEPREGLGFVRA